jgi:hypothetical protein
MLAVCAMFPSHSRSALRGVLFVKQVPVVPARKGTTCPGWAGRKCAHLLLSYGKTAGKIGRQERARVGSSLLAWSAAGAPAAVRLRRRRGFESAAEQSGCADPVGCGHSRVVVPFFLSALSAQCRNIISHWQAKARLSTQHPGRNLGQHHPRIPVRAPSSPSSSSSSSFCPPLRRCAFDMRSGDAPNNSDG